MSGLADSVRHPHFVPDATTETTETTERGAPTARRWSTKKRVAVVGAVLAALGVAVCGVVLATRGGEETAGPAAQLPKVTGDAIEVPPRFLETSGIATEAATRGALAPLVTVIGEVAFDPTLVGAVGTRAPGIVRKVFYVEGASVEKGTVLAEIESAGLADAEADKRIAAAKRSAAERNEDRETHLFERGLTTAREYEQAKAELAEQKALQVAAAERVAALGGGAGGGISQLRAPVSGIVAERMISPGQSVGPGYVAFNVGSLERLWVILRVYERHLQVIRAGDVVETRPVATPDRDFRGVVAHVGSVIDPMTRTADVRVEVENDELKLRPGQAVRATIRASGPSRVATSVPASAVVSVDGTPTVFVAETPTRFVARKVELGIDGGSRIEIASGVREGEQVVSKSVLALKAELFR